MKTKVYFNNSCSICRTEINQYKKHSGDKIDWVDISSSLDAEKETNIKTDDLYRRMHVLENGKLISGAKSFLIIWGEIPKYKFLKKIFEKPLIFPLFNIIYEAVAYLLYLKSKISR
ncbi:MAG: DUF393 domain-containing protein [Gammaproteobacteria bacterium]|jgi:predicted DCC family thiol-disulfide oxidoreductase YuxK|nr:DUF393 domain-containing protein [Gammaproteobacteria bacterium]|tara:strand:+ start:759 stop:1106 length:348 start_codon:yes stop_codon:yes gene_type:complete